MKYSQIAKLSAAECNALIRQCQKDMSTASADQRDHLRQRIAVLAQHAAYMGRFAAPMAEQARDSGLVPL